LKVYIQQTEGVASLKITIVSLLQKGGALFESGASCVIFMFY